jgi:hypothetical protein
MKLPPLPVSGGVRRESLVELPPPGLGGVAELGWPAPGELSEPPRPDPHLGRLKRRAGVLAEGRARPRRPRDRRQRLASGTGVPVRIGCGSPYPWTGAYGRGRTARLVLRHRGAVGADRRRRGAAAGGDRRPGPRSPRIRMRRSAGPSRAHGRPPDPARRGRLRSRDRRRHPRSSSRLAPRYARSSCRG